MPTYEFECGSCMNLVEKDMPMIKTADDEPHVECPHCKIRMDRIISRTSNPIVTRTENPYKGT